MKIYPAPHQVRATQKPRFTDIPVAHIEKNYIPDQIHVEPASGFAVRKDRYLAPYQSLPTKNILVFNENLEPVDIDLSYQNHRYIYQPQKSQEFSPDIVKISALLKRADVSNPMRDYNLKIGILNEREIKDTANTLISIFGDAPYRGISPANIRVNGRDTNPNNLIVNDGTDLDFLIVPTIDGSFTKDGDTQIDIDTLMKTHCNLWITVSDDGMSDIFDKVTEDYEAPFLSFDGSKIAFYTNQFVTIKQSYHAVVKYGAEYKPLPRTKNSYLLDASNGKHPVMIIERPNSGYVVISHENLFAAENLESYASYIYNILVSLYLRSYKETNTKELWITDDTVDYLGSLDMPFRKKHPILNIKDMVSDTDPTIMNFTVIGYNMTNQNVVFDQQDKDGNLYFRKLVRTDPQKNIDTTAIYTVQHTVIQYENPKVKLVEPCIQCATRIDELGNCYVTIDPFVSSTYRLRATKTHRFEIPDIEKTYALYALPINEQKESEIFLIEQERWKNMGAAVFLATVYVSFSGDPAAYDIRILGGGLPERYTDYEMLDIGNLKGRPYRIGTGAVITLPKAYQKYDQRIQDAVNQYKVAADQFYIVYK